MTTLAPLIPRVLDLHGTFGTDRQQRALSKLDDAAHARGAITRSGMQRTMNPSRIGVKLVPPKSNPRPSRRPPRMSSKTTVISSRTPPTSAHTPKTQSSIGIVIIRGRPTLPARRLATPCAAGDVADGWRPA